jgi:hypothetical protein
MSHLFDEDEVRRMSRRIAEEFEATYGTLDEKVSRVPDEAAKAIADSCGVHIEVARVAYRVMLDGVITDAEPCCSLLMKEIDRLAERGRPVPEIGSYMREVAITEGKWVEYLYGQLEKVLLQELRNLANLSRNIADEIEPAAEQVIAVIAQRQKIAEAYFTSLISRWMGDHEASTIADAIRAIAAGLLGITGEVNGAINSARASALIKFRRYDKFLHTEDEDESRLLEKVHRELQNLIDEIQKPLDQISPKAAAEILIEVLPPPPESIDEKPKYGYITAPFPRDLQVGPPLKTPLDMLERDIWLAKMQDDSTRATFLREKISFVINGLLDEGIPIEKVGTTIIFDMDARFTWSPSKKTEIRRELKELRETAGENYREQIETFVLENIIAKIPQLRTSGREE